MAAASKRSGLCQPKRIQTSASFQEQWSSTKSQLAQCNYRFFYLCFCQYGIHWDLRRSLVQPSAESRITTAFRPGCLEHFSSWILRIFENRLLILPGQTFSVLYYPHCVCCLFVFSYLAGTFHFFSWNLFSHHSAIHLMDLIVSSQLPSWAPQLDARFQIWPNES